MIYKSHYFGGGNTTPKIMIVSFDPYVLLNLTQAVFTKDNRVGENIGAEVETTTRTRG